MFNSSLSQPVVWEWYANNGYSAACKMCNISLYDLSINSEPGPPATLGWSWVLGMTASVGLWFLPKKRHFLDSLKISADGSCQLWSWEVWSMGLNMESSETVHTWRYLWRRTCRVSIPGQLWCGSPHPWMTMHVTVSKDGRGLIHSSNLRGMHVCGVPVYMQANTHYTC